LARDAADLDLALSVLAGPDDDEAVGYRVALPPPRCAALAGCRVGLLTEHPVAAMDREMRALLERTADALGDAGARVQRPGGTLPDLAAAHRVYITLLNTVTLRGRAASDRPPISAHRWMDLLDQRARLRRQWRQFFEQFDVLLLPPFGTAAFELTDEPDWHQRTLPIDGAETKFGEQLAWSGIATVAGLPATVVPAGRTAQGLPLGVQLVGPRGNDGRLLRTANWLVRHLNEQATTAMGSAA
jgi:amidase